MLLGFTAVQGLILLGVVLFVVVAIFAQRTMFLEEYGPGEVIFQEGGQGRHVYVIKAGTVEVLMKHSDGPQEAIGRPGSGEAFGEMALFRKAPRSATIRAVTAAQAFKMSPINFLALYTNLSGLRENFNQIMESRLRELELRK